MRTLIETLESAASDYFIFIAKYVLSKEEIAHCKEMIVSIAVHREKLIENESTILIGTADVINDAQALLSSTPPPQEQK